MADLFVSPHFDDAVGSCGGMIAALAARGQPATILTIFAGTLASAPSPFARALHRAAGLPDGEAVTIRAAEDRAAAARLGARTIRAPFLDAIYRHDAAGAWRYPDGPGLVGKAHPRDVALIDAIATTIAERADRLGGDVAIHAPIGLGDHVDHRLVATAADRLADAGRRVLRYEDFWWRDRTPPPRPQGMARRTIALSAADLDAKIAAFAAYRSQISGLYGSAAAMAARLRESAARDGGGGYGEVLWVPSEQA